MQSIQQECIDRFVIFGETHLDHVCQEFLEHYHKERPHQGVENELVIKPKKAKSAAVESISLDEIRCSQRLGGLLKSYGRRVA